MQSPHILNIEGHKLAWLPFNPTAKGPLIILIHGITASIHFWSPSLIAPFAAQGPTYALSLPGHYPATFPAGFDVESLTAATLARLLTHAIQTLSAGRPVILVGHSTGGFAVLNIAARTPALARGVISISGFSHGRWTGMLGLGQWAARHGPVSSWLFKQTYRLNRATRCGQRASWRIYSPRPRELLASPLLDEIFNSFYHAYTQLDVDAMHSYFARMPEIDISALLPQITAPTLVLAGDADPIVPPSQARLIAARVPHAELAMLPQVGHMPFLDAPAAYHATITAWLERQLAN